MTIYLDTSSLVKLYVNEPGRESVLDLVGGASSVFTSEVAYPEARAAFARRRRDASLTASEFKISRRAFEAEWPLFIALAVTSAICREAGDLAERYQLRGFDSIHLASFAVMLRGLQGRDDATFSSFDERLNAAARRLARALS